jgi:predicted XRE-type DNA-binding protein
MPKQKSLSEILRDKIRQSGMTQAALTKVCGVPQPRIAVFLGGGDIRLATAEKLMAYFGLTVGGGR